MERLYSMEKSHFWSRARLHLILDLLRTLSPGKQVLDVGCGTGHLVARLEETDFIATGIDPQPAFFSSHTSQLIQASAEKLPFPQESFDAVVMADVLEHLEEEAPLGEAFRVLVPGGILLLTVPAFPWLWSRRDERARHLRRYRTKDLHSIAHRFNGKLIDLRFYQCLLFPLFLLSRWLRISPDKETALPSWLNSLFFQINRLELWLGKWVRWPWGSSLIAVIKKP